jgi:hypothetical protein
VTLVGGFAVHPATSLTYELTVSNDTGQSAVCDATITVTTTPPPPPQNKPSCTLTVTPGTLANAGDQATLAWTSQNAVSASFSGGGGSVALSGSFYVHPTMSLMYELTVANANGDTAVCDANVTVPKAKQHMICILPKDMKPSYDDKESLHQGMNTTFQNYMNGMTGKGYSWTTSIDPNIELQDGQ